MSAEQELPNEGLSELDEAVVRATVAELERDDVKARAAAAEAVVTRLRSAEANMRAHEAFADALARRVPEIPRDDSFAGPVHTAFGEGLEALFDCGLETLKCDDCGAMIPAEIVQNARSRGRLARYCGRTCRERHKKIEQRAAAAAEAADVAKRATAAAKRRKAKKKT